MKNFLLIGADENNSTDGVIVQGIRHLLNDSFGLIQSSYVFIDDHKDMSTQEFHPEQHFDAVIVCGTPWLWDSFQITPKYRNMQLAFKTHQEAKKVFLGVGSCLNLKDVTMAILERPDEQKAMQNTYGDAYVVVRDKLAQHKLQLAGVQSTLLPCPAYWCYGMNPAPGYNNYNVLIWTDPKKTISHGDWCSPEKLAGYYEVVKKYIQVYHPLIFCAKEEDIQGALDIGLTSPMVLRSWEDTLELMGNSGFVLSGRVHCAVPAYVKGAAVGLLPIDSRSGVLSDFGCPLIVNPDDLNKMSLEHRDFSKYNNDYREFLRKL
jgi:hypothetical protein